MISLINTLIKIILGLVNKYLCYEDENMVFFYI